MGDLGLSKKGKHMAQEPGSLAFRFAHLVLALLAVIATAVPASGAANRTGKHLSRSPASRASSRACCQAIAFQRAWGLIAALPAPSNLLNAISLPSSLSSSRPIQGPAPDPGPISRAGTIGRAPNSFRAEEHKPSLFPPTEKVWWRELRLEAVAAGCALRLKSANVKKWNQGWARPSRSNCSDHSADASRKLATPMPPAGLLSLALLRPCCFGLNTP